MKKTSAAPSATAGANFLVVDAGNTSVHFGVCDSGRILDTFRVPSVTAAVLQQAPPALKRRAARYGPLSGALISSVVPRLNPALRAVCRRVCRRLVWLGCKTPSGIKLLYPNPREIGADRLANVAAAVERYGSPAIVVDIGTAITFDCISPSGGYMGGVIAPGPRLSRAALAERTGLLPLADLAAPPGAIGKSTVHAIQSGMIYGTRALITGIVAELRRAIRGRPRVIFTGGQLELIIEGWRYPKIIDPLLTLHGLRIIYNRVAAGKSL